MGEKPEGRLCKMCERQQIENEMHFCYTVLFMTFTDKNYFRELNSYILIS